MKVAVVISTWNGNPLGHLLRICESLNRHPAGLPYDLVLSANGLNYTLPARLAPQFSAVFVRENKGFNLGAWDYAWRRLPGHDHFLFLQDDCVVFRNGWLRDFARRFHSIPRCGLLGENIERSLDRPWLELCDPRIPRDGKKKAEAERLAEWSRFFRDQLREWSIPEGLTARTVTTVVQFTSRLVLEKTGGYNIGESKLEATAAEIGFSRKVEASGYVVAQIGRWRHSRIGHPQWARNTPLARLRRSINKRLPWEGPK